jgi:pimeloyl-ACP methyl ester carboxylesterase
MMSDDKLRLQSYDHGTVCTNRTTFSETCNQERYGALEPPEYDLSLITTPQAILAGQLDLIAVPEDIVEQRRRLAPGVLVAEVTYIGYSHMDFVWDRHAKHMPDVVDIVSRYASGTF